MLKSDAAVETQVALRCSKLVHSGCFLAHQRALQKTLNFHYKDQPVNIFFLEVISVF